MSLDVYLMSTEACPNCGHRIGTSNCVFSANITHNLGRMASKATSTLYEALWRPEELMDVAKAEQIRALEREYFDRQCPETRPKYDEAQRIRETLPKPHASDLICHLRDGIAALERDPAKFIALEPDNKWGTYKDFVPWVRRYLEACEANPTALVEVSR